MSNKQLQRTQWNQTVANALERSVVRLFAIIVRMGGGGVEGGERILVLGSYNIAHKGTDIIW